MSIEILSKPTTNLLHLDDVKNHLRVTTTAEDHQIEYLLLAAQEKAESFTQRSLLIRKYRMRLDGFQTLFELPYGPLVKVNSIEYVDTNGTTQTLDSSVYTVDRYQPIGQVFEAYNQDFPTTRSVANSVIITYQAGYMAPCTISQVTDTVTVVDNPFSDGDIVYLHGSDGEGKELPTGLSEYVAYYVVETSGNDFKLSLTSGGSAIDIGGPGSGIFFVGYEHIPNPFILAIKLMITDWYYNKGNVDQVIPAASYHLLMPYRVDVF